MNKKSILILLCIAVFASGYYFYKHYPKQEEVKITEEQKTQAWDIATKLAQCSGYFESLSWLTEKTEEHETSIGLHNIANGWDTASSYTLNILGVVPDHKKAMEYSKGIKEAMEQHFKASIESSLNSSNEAINAAKAEMDKFYEETCKPLTDYQTDTIMRVRQLIATIPDK